MKPEEIIKYLEMVRPTENYSHTFSVSVGNTRHFGPGSQLNKDVSKAIDLAIEALENQVPKKPRIINGGTNTCHDTDCCNDVFRWYSYCPVCGQRIDWSE